MVAVDAQPGNIYVVLHTCVDTKVVHTNIIFSIAISIETGSYSCFQLHPLCNARLASYIRNNFHFESMFYAHVFWPAQTNRTLAVLSMYAKH
jgi:hypothetical protein